jgi:hypothetical protein
MNLTKIWTFQLWYTWGISTPKKTLGRGRVKLELHTRQITLVKDILYVFGFFQKKLSM